MTWVGREGGKEAGREEGFGCTCIQGRVAWGGGEGGTDGMVVYV